MYQVPKYVKIIDSKPSGRGQRIGEHPVALFNEKKKKSDEVWTVLTGYGAGFSKTIFVQKQCAYKLNAHARVMTKNKLDAKPGTGLHQKLLGNKKTNQRLSPESAI